MKSNVQHQNARKGRRHVRPYHHYSNYSWRQVTPLAPPDQGKSAGGNQAEHEPRACCLGADAVSIVEERQGGGGEGLLERERRK